MKKTIYIILSAFILITSCSESFLEREIPVKREISAFYRTPEDFYGALMDNYSVLQSDALANARWIIGDVASDDALKGGETAGDLSEAQQLAEFRPLANAGGPVKDLWVDSYKGVTKAGIIIEKIDEVDFGDEDLRLMYRSEAQFLRAISYYYIAMAYGDAPLLVDGIIDFTDIDPVLLEKKPVAQIWSLIESDLNEAIPNLATKSELEQANQVGRATQGAARALLGKVLMFQRKYDEAVPVLKAVVESPEYSLMSDYGSLFRPEGEFCDENIFEINYINMNSGWGDDAEGSPRAVYQHSRDDWGWGFNQPTQDLVDEFEDGDPRVIYTVNWPEDEFTAGVPQKNGQYNPYGFSNRKIYLLEGERPANVFSAGMNEVLIRLADMYLLYAEALMKSSSKDATTALFYLNEVRSRANTTPKVDPERVVQAFEVAANSIPMRVYTTDEQLIEDIYHERRVELGMEGIRWWDLVRQGRTGLMADYYQEWSVDKGFAASGDIKGKFYDQWVSALGKSDYPVLPVPQSEIDASQGHLTQTTGY